MSRASRRISFDAGLGLVVLMLASSPVVADRDGEPRPLKVSARAASGVHHAGEAIPVRVEVAGAAGPASIEPPRIAAAEVVRLANEGDDPDGVGTTIARFVVVPRRSGPLVIPPFRARSGTSAGSSAPIRLVVADVPAAGRPTSFLGGVGDFSVRAEAEPASLRAGQTLEYRVRVEGPAAWGGARPPDLTPWTARIPGLRVVPRAAEGPGASEPPTRTFRYRVRPTRAGRWTLPPVAVSAYDPGIRSFVTRSTSGVPIQVAEPPRLDPADVADHSGQRSRPDASWPGIGPRAMLTLGGLAAGAALIAVVAAWVGGRFAGRGDDPGRYARGLALDLDPAWDAPEAARRIAEGLAEYLRRRTDRPPGALTPPEIEAALARLTDDPGLPGRARRLLEGCDRARFDAGDGGGEGLVIEARALLGDLAGVGAKRKGKKPREAAETAMP